MNEDGYDVVGMMRGTLCGSSLQTTAAHPSVNGQGGCQRRYQKPRMATFRKIVNRIDTNNDTRRDTIRHPGLQPNTCTRPSR
jgi:hypothetical protein